MARRLALLATALLLAVALVPAEARRSRSAGSSIVELGRRLFMDPAASRGERFSCASCHDPEHGFSDPRTVSVDENGPTARHSQPVLDLRDGTGMHWDGEFDHVRELLVARLETPGAVLEQTAALHQRRCRESSRSRGEPDEEEFRKRMQALTPPYYGPAVRTPSLTTPSIARRLHADGRYAAGFLRTFGSSRVTEDRMIAAMEAYLLSLHSGENAYDRFARGDEEALSPAARRGLELFTGKANCASCHTIGKRGRAEFSDRQYHNTGVAFVGRPARDELAFEGAGGPGGRGVMSFVAGDIGSFKTPSLRDVGRRPTYMHDGSLATLEDVVRYYVKGGTENPGLDHGIAPLDLDEGDVSDLVAFLRALSSDERPGLGPLASWRPASTRVRVLSLEGEPIAGLRLHVVPFGDRLGDAEAPADALTCTTDDRGWAEFAFPPWTHVRVLAPGYELDEGQVLPDFARRHVFHATPLARVSVRVLAPRGVGSMPDLLTARANRGGAETAVLVKARSLGQREAIYVVRPGHPKQVVNVFFDWTPSGSDGLPRRLDMRGGASEMIDLATDPTEPRLPTIVAGVPRGTGARPSASSERIADRTAAPGRR